MPVWNKTIQYLVFFAMCLGAATAADLKAPKNATKTIPPYALFGHDQIRLLKTSVDSGIERTTPVERVLNDCFGAIPANSSLIGINYIHRTGSFGEDFVPFNGIDDENADWVIRVGPQRNVKTLAEASKIARDGDVVLVDGGVYSNDISVWRQNNLTIMGQGKVELMATAPISHVSGSDAENGKGIMVVQGNNVRLINLAFIGASVPDKNGAGIRHEGGRLWVCRCEFKNNENGILSSGAGLEIDYSLFDNNGHGDSGKTHQIYASSGKGMIVFGSEFRNMNFGHHIKSRLPSTEILYSWIDDYPDSTTSYSVDISNGGRLKMIGNFVRQGEHVDNSTMIAFAPEGANYSDNSVELIHNTFVNLRHAGRFINAPKDVLVRSFNNAFLGVMELDQRFSDEGLGNVVAKEPNEKEILATSGVTRLKSADRPGWQIVAPRELKVRDVALDSGKVDSGYRQLDVD